MWDRLNSVRFPSSCYIALRLAMLVSRLLVYSVFDAFGEGVVTNCTEAELRTALNGGGTVTFACNGTITVTNTLIITTNTVIDAGGRNVTISGNATTRIFTVESSV